MKKSRRREALMATLLEFLLAVFVIAVLALFFFPLLREGLRRQEQIEAQQLARWRATVATGDEGR